MSAIARSQAASAPAASPTRRSNLGASGVHGLVAREPRVGRGGVKDRQAGVRAVRQADRHGAVDRHLDDLDAALGRASSEHELRVMAPWHL